MNNNSKNGNDKVIDDNENDKNEVEDDAFDK